MMVANGIFPSLLGSRVVLIYLIYASVGQCPSPLTKMGNCEVGMVPVSYLSKMEKSS